MESAIQDGMRICWDVVIEVDDGTALKCDVFLPVEEGRYPVLLSHGPYAKGLSFQEGYTGAWESLVRTHPEVTANSSGKYQCWEVADPEKWVPEGYACVRVDSRGAGCSPGVIDPYSPRETRDLYDCIEWAGTQEWSNGRVGLCGISYYAINQWQVAALQPPHLAAICPWEGACDWYREGTHHGGILTSFFENWYESQVKAVQHGLGARGPRSPVTGRLACGEVTLSDAELERNRIDLGEQLRKHPFVDEYYTKWTPDKSEIIAPLFSTANWGGQGLHLRGNVEGYLGASSDQKWLEIHGLEHWTHFYTDFGRELQKKFFDYFLKGEDTGWSSQPPVLLHVRHVDGTFVLRSESEWPLARTEWTRFYLDASDRSLSEVQGAGASSESFPALGEGLTFLSAPFERQIEVTGPIAVKLWVSSSTDDADVFVVLRLFDDTGGEVVFQGAVDPYTPLGQGWLRVSHRQLDLQRSTEYRPYHLHTEALSVVPGGVYVVDIEVWPTCIVVPSGYRLGLSVQGHDYEYAKAGDVRLHFKNVLRGCGPFLHDDARDRPRPRFDGRTTVHTGGERGSYVLLPIIPNSC
jgi:uncharacterized protein